MGEEDPTGPCGDVGEGALLERVRQIVDNDDDRWRLAIPPEWVAVPAPGGLHFLSVEGLEETTPEARGWQLHVIDLERMEVGSRDAWAREWAKDRRAGWDVFSAIQGVCGLRDFALVPCDCRWIVVHSRESFVIVAGDEETVLSLLDEPTVARARAEFEEFEKVWRDEEAKRLAACARIDWASAPGRLVWV